MVHLLVTASASEGACGSLRRSRFSEPRSSSEASKSVYEQCDKTVSQCDNSYFIEQNNNNNNNKSNAKHTKGIMCDVNNGSCKV